LLAGETNGASAPAPGLAPATEALPFGDSALPLLDPFAAAWRMCSGET